MAGREVRKGRAARSVGRSPLPGERGPEVRISAEEAETATVRPDKPAMTLEQLRPYYLGAYYATIAVQKKLEDSGPEGKASYKKVSDYQELINEYSEALQETAQT